MAGMELPYWRCYAAETLSDSRFQSWDLAERGAFWSLLNIQWREGAVPGDQTTLAKLLHVDGGAMRSLWSAIGDRFIPHPDKPGMLANPRMEEARDEAIAAMNQKKRAGKAGAESRWRTAKRANGGRIAAPSRTDGEESKAKQGRVEAAQVPPPSDEPEAKPLEVVDESGPWDSADPFPLVARFRDALMRRCARTALHPVGGGREVFESGERALAIIGEADAVRLCHERVVEAVKRRDRQPGTLKFFVECVLGDELTRRASEPKRQGRVIGLDEKTGALIREEIA
jgi:hypothetical protein